MRFTNTIISTAILLLSLTLSAQAETRYISDQLVVTVRSNKAKNYEVLTTLITASPVEILEDGKTYVKVRTKKGIEGYIRRQYVTKAIPKSVRLANLKREKAKLEDKLKRQQLEFQGKAEIATSSQSTITQLTDTLEQTEQQLEKISKDYAQLQERSENVVKVTTERDQLLEENSQIISELKILQEENKGFHRSNMIQWFLAGGGVFFVGWLAGKVSRKKRRYSSF